MICDLTAIVSRGQKYKIYLLVVLGCGTDDGQLWAAGFGFRRLARIEEGLYERLQVLSFLEDRGQCGAGVSTTSTMYII